MACILTIGSVWAGGCGRAGPTPSAGSQPSVVPVEIVLKTPEAAARSLLQALRAELQAVARGDKAGAERQRDRTADQVLARDEIMARYRKVAGRFAQDEPHALGALVENWAGIISYYADALGLDQMRTVVGSGDAGGAVVDVPARGPQDQAVIRITCVRGKDELWRVNAVEFAPRAPAAIPAGTQPTSAPRP